ncbi:MAG: type II secretion system protein [Clostridiales bacterium]|jgi:prepilin-type N-terminal cleavage/methylation domain-containing protein|nr:type II secretion system protein [Clostridiales bacterium]
MNKTRGMTLIEILAALSILALIAGFLLTSYGFSFKHNKKAERMLRASFIAQTKMERLQSMDALSAYYEGRGRLVQDSPGYYVQTLCQPYIPEDCHPFSIVIKDMDDAGQGYVLYAVPPGGMNVFLLEDSTDDISLELSISSHSYSLGIPGSGQADINGTLPDDNKKVVVVVNAVGYSGSHHITFSIISGGRRTEVKLYDTDRNSQLISVTGISEKRYSNFVYRDYSMIRALVKVFTDETGVEPKAVLESILRLQN